MTSLRPAAVCRKSAVDITEPSELDFYQKAFELLRRGAVYGDAAKELLRKARSFWTSAPLRTGDRDAEDSISAWAAAAVPLSRHRLTDCPQPAGHPKGRPGEPGASSFHGENWGADRGCGTQELLPRRNSPAPRQPTGWAPVAGARSRADSRAADVPRPVGVPKGGVTGAGAPLWRSRSSSR